MSLSAHEQIEFERLTADLQFHDSDIRKMTRRDKATAMSYMALPTYNTMLMMFVFINVFVFVSAVLTHNVALTNVAGVLGGLLTAAVVINSVNRISSFDSKPKTGK